MPDHPSVSLLLPVLNEVEHIDACLDSLAAQDYAGPIEVLVAEGGSTDGTVERLRHRAGEDALQLRVIPNPQRLQSHGLNLLASESAAEVLIRADAHTTYAPDYVSTSVDALLGSDAVAVGGRLNAEGRTKFGEAVAFAMRSRLAIGPGRFHHATAPVEADTVYLGTFRRSDFLVSGGYRALPHGVAEDADLYYRWRTDGRTILLDPAIESTYLPRETVRSLFRQFYRYGAGKADMLYINRSWPSWRPLGPMLLVTGLIAFLVLAAITGIRWPFWVLTAVWVIALLLATRIARHPMVRIRVFAAAAIMHLAYGLGLLKGLIWRKGLASV